MILGPNLSPRNLRPGDIIVAKYKKIYFKIEVSNKTGIWARMRRGPHGTWSQKIVEIVPAEVIGFRLEAR